MFRQIEYAPAYMKKAQKIAKKNPHLKDIYTATLKRLVENPFDPLLHTHSLTGDMEGKYACSLTYDLRIVFKLYDDIV